MRQSTARLKPQSMCVFLVSKAARLLNALMNPKTLAALLITLIVGIWAAWWCFGRSAEDEVRAAQSAFLKKVEKRDWEAVKLQLATDYRDAYGHDRESAVTTAAEVLAGFLFLEVLHQKPTIQMGEPVSRVDAIIRMEGNGLGYSAVVVGRVNQMQAPWAFLWRKDGPWPWSWKVTRIHQDELPATIPF